ncbi:CPBP family intramembrane glutamic endopeptidase [Spirochaeta cellobiosiphila]|uniref:CPBP family intramembrane glutamic endopeptidase n=1 Tax=Spirochaeta cellobiosiphila TaxID=504483 RepID=UPI000411EA49|nr:type II CAAX endopeptidase family protein [Spirochaeta cellobiosiphila]
MNKKLIDFFKVISYYLGALSFSTIILIPYLLMNESNNGGNSKVLLLLAASGATISAFATISIFDGKSGLLKLLKRIIKIKFKWYWYAISVLLMPIIVSVLWLIGRNMNIPFENPLQKLQGLLSVFLILSIQAGLGEEVGWRGLMTPTLNRRLPLIPSALITGVLWGFWHTPLFFIEGTFQSELYKITGFLSGMGWYILFLSASSILYSFIVKKSGGSIIGAILFHGSLNSATWLVGANNISSSLAGLKALTLVTVAVSLAFYVVFRKDECWKPSPQ